MISMKLTISWLYDVSVLKLKNWKALIIFFRILEDTGSLIYGITMSPSSL